MHDTLRLTTRHTCASTCKLVNAATPSAFTATSEFDTVARSGSCGGNGVVVADDGEDDVQETAGTDTTRQVPTPLPPIDNVSPVELRTSTTVMENGDPLVIGKGGGEAMAKVTDGMATVA